ncbi:MAG: YjbE family putative metal transport protein, partial [Betaproteobacteria bacterium]|nr:YjbE family putative metal transport protein [Betaproteobacteria bacterium]
MEFSADWFARLAAIIFVDLVLAGDNAVVIALAARNLPKHLQKKAVYAGTAGAIVVRVALVFFALKLLELPGLRLAGGLLLFYVAWKLIKNDDSAHESKTAVNSFWAAMRTIIIADTVMGLDNILAIAGASGGDLALVIFGFLLSIPIMVGGSMLILKLMEKAPWLIT